MPFWIILAFFVGILVGIQIERFRLWRQATDSKPKRWNVGDKHKKDFY